MNKISNFIRQEDKKLHTLHGQIAKSKHARNWNNMVVLAVMTLPIFSFAQSPRDSHKHPPYTWRDVLTTARDITFLSTRERASLYSPDSGVKEGKSLIPIKSDIRDTGEIGNPVVVKAGFIRLGTITYPAGTPVRIIKTLKMKDGTEKYVILIGETREQAVVGPEAIVETGGTPGPAVEVRSIQAPKEFTSAMWDGPEGIFTGLAVGDENIDSDKEAEQVIFRLVNDIRVKHGLKPLIWDEDLARAARYQAADCYVQQYSAEDHSSLDYYRWAQNEDAYSDPGGIPDSAKERILRFVVGHRSGGENVGGAILGGITPEKAVTRWMKSPGHRANILRPNWRRTGIGYINRPLGKQVQVFSD